MKISKNGLELIMRHEGCRLTAYKCPAGVWTIGYGHTGTDVVPGLTITSRQAEELLTEDVRWAEEAVNREGLRLNQNQFDALVSFTFNVGIKNFRNSTLLKMIQIDSSSANIRTEFGKWNRAKGFTLPGLALRRKAEADLYFSNKILWTGQQL